MEKKPIVPIMLAGVLVAALGGCTVEEVREARAPDVDVEVDPGRWPQYRVKWADIDVGTTERSIGVPVVRVGRETRTITVPYIDINPPGARNRHERLVSLDVLVPHAGYEVQIKEIRASSDDLWVIGQLRETKPSRAKLPNRISDQVLIHAPEDLDIRTIIVGEKPDGAAHEHRFVRSMSELDGIVPAGARVIYRRDENPVSTAG